MIVYITQKQRTKLSRMAVDGLPVWRLEAGSGFFARLRVARLLEELYRSGVRRCICGEGAPVSLAARAGILPVSVLPLRLALAGGLVDALCPGGLGDGCAVLRCGRGGEDAARAVLPVLAGRARYLRLEMDEPAPLARELLYRWGIAAGDGGRPAVLTVLCGRHVESGGGRALWLTPDCGRRQRLCWTSPRAEDAPVPATEQLCAALVSAGKWQPSDIHITSLLDIRAGNHYNAT